MGFLEQAGQPRRSGPRVGKTEACVSHGIVERSLGGQRDGVLQTCQGGMAEVPSRCPAIYGWDPKILQDQTWRIQGREFSPDSFAGKATSAMAGAGQPASWRIPVPLGNLDQ